MKYARRVEIFEKTRARYAGFLTSVLWKLAGNKEIFVEAFQYALLGIWQNIEKLNGKKAGAYIYRIALSANSKAWRNRIGRDGQIDKLQLSSDKGPRETAGKNESIELIGRAIAQLPPKQAAAVVMRYLEQKDYKALAEELRCSQAGARSHISKALATLKDKLSILKEEAE